MPESASENRRSLVFRPDAILPEFLGFSQISQTGREVSGEPCRTRTYEKFTTGQRVGGTCPSPVSESALKAFVTWLHPVEGPSISLRRRRSFEPCPKRLIAATAAHEISGRRTMPAAAGFSFASATAASRGQLPASSSDQRRGNRPTGVAVGRSRKRPQSLRSGFHERRVRSALSKPGSARAQHLPRTDQAHSLRQREVLLRLRRWEVDQNPG